MYLFLSMYIYIYVYIYIYICLSVYLPTYLSTCLSLYCFLDSFFFMARLYIFIYTVYIYICVCAIACFVRMWQILTHVLWFASMAYKPELSKLVSWYHASWMGRIHRLIAAKGWHGNINGFKIQIQTENISIKTAKASPSLAVAP